MKVVLFLSLCFVWLVEGATEEERIEAAKLDLWSRGAFALDETVLYDDTSTAALGLEWQVAMAPLRMGPVRQVRKSSAMSVVEQLRGGGEAVEERIHDLETKFGPEFVKAIEQNKKDHADDCKLSCESYYCAPPGTPLASLEDILNQTTIASYSMGAVPPEDFASDFGFPLDLIKVSEGKPLFSAEEAAQVLVDAETEGVDKNEFKSGKYQLGGDWLTNLPKTREWFNRRLESTFFPLLTHLFPEVISSPSVLRAHSVSLLKYNSSHPRTDVHIDNGILAMTLAMTPQHDYTGGGTFFEHMGVENVLPMDVGHATLRPGSVRHGGHRVTQGTRYILGAFLLLEDRVEHVRRLKNRGSELRLDGDLAGAARHFEWALALNPKCTTCLKDWAEVLHAQKQFAEAEAKLREALTLLENKDSDALFTLGVLLSEQGKDDESIAAYEQSVSLNEEDAELCYNLGVKLGAKGKVKEEMQMYARATRVDPTFGGAWLNWGTTLAEQGNMDDAEVMFLKAIGCDSQVAPKAMMNLALVYQYKANSLAQGGDVAGAKQFAVDASNYLDSAKPLLEELQAAGNAEAATYMSRFGPLRLQSYKLLGQVYVGLGDYPACETQFRAATEAFPDEPLVWQMLGKILELQGRQEEAQAALEKFKAIVGGRAGQ